MAGSEVGGSRSSGVSLPAPSTPPLDVLIINVGGRHFPLSQQLLASRPQTRLGRLARCSPDSVLELCDDADFLQNEFFFDRNAQPFQYVVNFYHTGQLHVMEEQCQISFLQEIRYWGLDELWIQPCCRERFHRRKEQRQSPEEWRGFENRDEDFVGAACPALRRHLWNLLEKPESSCAARAVGSLSVFFVVLSVVNMVLISLDWGRSFGGRGLGAPWPLDVLEYVCVAWFTGELLLRFLCVRDKWRFGRSVPNLIDLLAVLPFYVTLAVENLRGGPAQLENMGRVVQVLRLLRTLRMLKLGRHSTGLRSLGMTMAQCYEEVGLLLLFLCVGISIFAATAFALEHDVPATTFTSVPTAWWWATTSMTTVGYGDVRPDTAVGKVLAAFCILSGILILALPIAIINDRFSACYFTLKIREAALRHGDTLKRLARRSAGGGAEGGPRDAYPRGVPEMQRLKGHERAETLCGGRTLKTLFAHEHGGRTASRSAPV